MPHTSSTLAFALAALVLLATGGCSGKPSFRAVLDKDTIAAYEDWMKTADKTDADYISATVRLEKLRWEKTQADGTIEAYDLFLSQYPPVGDASYPEGFTPMFRDKAFKDRENVLWTWADVKGDKAAFERYLKEYPNAGKKRKAETHRRIHMLENIDRVSLGPLKQERVNLAENPEGPLDGWGFWVDVTNKGPDPVERINLTIYYLNEQGKSLDRHEWPVVAKRLPGNLPFADGFDKPMKPGETRTWEWTDGDIPDGWSQKVRVVPTDILLVGEKKAPADETDP
jgi:hypothetical protein